MNMFEIFSNSNSAVIDPGTFSLQQNWLLFMDHLQKLNRVHLSQMQTFAKQVKNNLTKAVQIAPNCAPVIQQYYLHHFQSQVKTLLTHYSTSNQPQSQKQQHQFEALQELQFCYTRYRILADFFDNEKRVEQHLKAIVQRAVSNLQVGLWFPYRFREAFKSHSMKIFEQDIIDFEEEVKEFLTQRYRSSANGNLGQIKTALEIFKKLELFQEYFSAIFYFLTKELQQFLQNCTDLQKNSKFLGSLLNYFNTFQSSFLKKLQSDQTENEIGEFRKKLEESCYLLCTHHCSERILDIVLDYPDSHGIILVLKRCLDRCKVLNQLAQNLERGVKRRLLIPGVITQSILNQYLNMLKVLQILDPHGTVFEKLTVPIKNYLLKRNDTLRCIISHMTQNGEISSGLTRDMVRIPSKEYIEEASSDENQQAAEQWQILNLKETKTKVRVKYQEIDLATVLVNLYGSQEAFILEYQNMLAQKLMSAKDYNIEEEIRNIQLLKMRFGQNALQMCNVIVKDVKDSRKNDLVVHKELKSSNKFSDFSLQQMNCLAVSKGYWPINYQNSSTFELPAQLKEVFQQYAEAYSKIKVMRKIHYHYNLGHVNLTLSFKNGDFQFKCLPIHAVIINYFDEKYLKESKGVSSDELSNLLQIPPNLVKQRMSFWVHKGVVKEHRPQKQSLSLRRINSMEEIDSIHYKVVEEYVNVPRDDIEEALDQFISKQNTSLESHLRHILQGLIVSILNINGPKSPQKIHLLLKTVYKTDLDFNYGEAQTNQILKKMVQKKRITFNGETYACRPQLR